MDFLSLGAMKTTAGVLQGVGLGLGAFGAYNEAKSQKAALKYSAQVSRTNAKIAEWAASSILQKGAADEQAHRLAVAQTKGSQIARLAANGVAVDEGSALNLLRDTDFMGEKDALTIRDNAARDAWGQRVAAVGQRNEARMATAQANAINPAVSAGLSLIGGATRVASSWYQYSKTTEG